MASLSNINGLFDVHSTGAILFSTSHGTSGQILKSNGNAAPTWIPQSDIVGAYLPLAGGTLTGATATATGISFTVGGILTGTTATFAANVGIGVAAHGTASLNITSTDQHIRLNNGSELGIINLDADGKLDLWAHGTDETISFRTGTGSGIVTMSVVGGNVGIGTTSPSAKLEVRGTAPTYTNASTVFWGGTTNNDSHNGIMLSSYGDALGGSLASNLLYSNSNTPTQTNTNRSSGEIIFSNTTVASQTATISFGGYYKGTTSFVERMRITSGGNIIFGNAGPQSNVPLQVDYSGGNASLWGQLNQTMYFNARPNGTTEGMAFQINGSTDMFLRRDGNVGIGTTSPGQKLEVAGRIRVTTDPTIEFYESSSKRGGIQWSTANDYTNIFAVGGDIRFDIGGEKMRITSGGAVQIGTTNSGSKLNVGGTIAAATNNGASGMIVPRSYGISWGGATFTHTFDPVALFGQQFRGGQVLFECTGWQMAMNNGYIMWRNAGGSNPIGTGGSVQYVQTAYVSGGQSGSNTIAVSLNSGTNNITITFTGWHGNSHGFMCRITTNYS